MSFEFWIYQGSQYISGNKHARIQSIPEFWICLNNSWNCLIMSRYVWICLNMTEYAWICLNLPEWLLFYVFLLLHLFYNSFSTWMHSYLFERQQETSGYSLRKHDTVFLKRQNWVLFIAAGGSSFFSFFFFF